MLLESTEEASVVNFQDKCQSATPLMLAAAPGHIDSLQLLLSYGSGWHNVVTNKGLKARWSQCHVGCPVSYNVSKVIFFLLRHWVTRQNTIIHNVTMVFFNSCSDTGSPDQRGHTALAWAVVAGQEEAVKLLLAADKLGALFSCMFSLMLI